MCTRGVIYAQQPLEKKKKESPTFSIVHEWQYTAAAAAVCRDTQVGSLFIIIIVILWLWLQWVEAELDDLLFYISTVHNNWQSSVCMTQSTVERMLIPDRYKVTQQQLQANQQQKMRVQNQKQQVSESTRWGLSPFKFECSNL